MPTNHGILTVFEFSPAFPLFFIAIPIFIMSFVARYGYSWMEKNNFTLSKYELRVNSEIPAFFEAVKYQHSSWLVQENRAMQERYNFEFVQPEAAKKLAEYPTW